MNVVNIDKKTAEIFVTNKHYSRRASIFWAGYGLVENGKIVGVAVYGQPSPALQRFAFKDRDFRMFELARVVVQTSTKNATSFLVGNSLKQLYKDKGKCAVVSYADSEWGHVGTIYQATNWLYTGATVSHDKMYLVDGKRVHPMTLRDRGITSPVKWAKENDIEMVKPMPKHRYFMLLGNKWEVRDMKEKLKYPVINEYPKAPDNRERYDDGEWLEVDA